MSDLSHLRVLDIAHNNLPAVPSVVAKMPALEVLNLANNRIDSEFFFLSFTLFFLKTKLTSRKLLTQIEIHAMRKRKI